MHLKVTDAAPTPTAGGTIRRYGTSGQDCASLDRSELNGHAVIFTPPPRAIHGPTHVFVKEERSLARG
jgi:hypothetical protein